MKHIAALVAWVLLLAGCGQPVDPHTGLSANGRVMKRPGSQTLVKFSENDPQIKAAVAEARKSLPTFIQRLENRKAVEKFSIKVGLPTPNGTLEHIWAEDVTYADGVFKGKLDDEPFNLPGMHKGSEVSVPEASVEDWGIENFQTRSKEGGFSDAVLNKVEQDADK